MRNLKKVIALVAVFAMMISTVAFATAFDDVTEDNNYYEAIQTLNKLGILTGDDNNNDGVLSFRPDDSITRAEITVIVSRIQGTTGAVAQANTIFTDVPSTYWASGYIASATNQGIINGYGNGMFGPDDKVQYQDVVKMLMETLGYKYYAQNNGGYPTGYMIAAQRQEVLKGVVGGAEGTEATRGQVAQMTNNAIDTPLMDRVVYGGSDQYVIYDGEQWSPRKTLMSQALGINKIRGIVTENEVTGLDSAVQIDSDAAKEIKVQVIDNFLGTNDTTGEYEVGSIYSMYVGDTDAADYLGYDVTLYAQDNKNDTDTILSITETQAKNTKTSFVVSDFVGYDGSYISYMKNDTDRSATKLKVQAGAKVIYNGIAIGPDSGKDALSTVFSAEGAQDAIIYEDCAYSGQVTMLDNDDISGYDVVFVDVAAGAVVDEVSSRGVVTFKNTVGNSRNTRNDVRRVEFNSSNTDQYIEITKDGQPFDYTALKEWDVLSIVANTQDAQSTYMEIEVLDGETTKINGSVSRTAASTSSADGYCYTINGVDYDLADGYYNNGTLRAGSAGAFYVDQYGKIVAYNKDGSSASATGDNYAYVLQSSVSDTGFSKNVPTLQILYKDGTLTTVEFASTVTIDNPTAAIKTAANEAQDVDSVSLRYKDCSTEQINDVLDDIVGSVITLNAADGYLKSMTLATDNKATESTLILEKTGDYDYDSDTQQVRVGGTRYDVAEDTLVFFVGQPGDKFEFGAEANGEPVENCKVGTGAELSTNTGAASAAYTNGSDGVLDVLVLYNTDIAAGPSSSICYVTAVGQSYDDGVKVLSVSYYQNGELKTAMTDDQIIGDLSINTVPGSLFKFGMTGDKITSATSYLTFNGTVRDKIVAGDDFTVAGIPNVDKLAATNGDEEVYFGAVVEKSGNRLTVAPLVNGVIEPDTESWQAISLSRYTANYYLYDPTRSNNAKFQLGSLGDIYCDKTLTNDAGRGSYTVEFGGVTKDAPAWGMLDYVFVRLYDNTADVVDYTTWEYDYR